MEEGGFSRYSFFAYATLCVIWRSWRFFLSFYRTVFGKIHVLPCLRAIYNVYCYGKEKNMDIKKCKIEKKIYLFDYSFILFL